MEQELSQCLSSEPDQDDKVQTMLKDMENLLARMG
jgi:hypothetical protein